MLNIAEKITGESLFIAPQLIDKLGYLKAQIAALQIQEQELRSLLISTYGPTGTGEGHAFRVAISTATRETLDMAAVREKLSPQWIARHTNRVEVTSVRVSARSTK